MPSMMERGIIMELQMLSISLRAHDMALKRLSNEGYPSKETAMRAYLDAYNEIFILLYEEAQKSTMGY